MSLALPATNERLSHGSPTFFIGDKRSFVMFVDNHHNDNITGIWCAAPHGEQQARLSEDSDRFFRPPYVGGRGWLGVRLDQPKLPVTDQELDEVIIEAWRAVAPLKLLSTFDRETDERREL